MVGLQEIDLEPGQFIMGRKAAAADTGLSEQEVRSATATLVGSRNLTIKSTNKFTIVSIVNWDTYQHRDLEINQQINQQITNKQPTNNQQITTNNKDNKEKNNTYSVDFMIFYQAYPRKVAKLEAWKSWEKCNGDRPDISIIINAVERQKKSVQWKKDNGQFIPHPATWINKKRWEDEVDVEESKPFG